MPDVFLLTPVFVLFVLHTSDPESEIRHFLPMSQVEEKSLGLLSPLNAGAFVLKNRVIMAPLTRCRCGPNHTPTPLMVFHFLKFVKVFINLIYPMQAQYYAQRASAGLVICECTAVVAGASAFAKRDPGIYSEEQVC
jgi:N-ethylmaleimide reductase